MTKVFMTGHFAKATSWPRLFIYCYYYYYHYITLVISTYVSYRVAVAWFQGQGKVDTRRDSVAMIVGGLSHSQQQQQQCLTVDCHAVAVPVVWLNTCLLVSRCVRFPKYTRYNAQCQLSIESQHHLYLMLKLKLITFFKNYLRLFGRPESVSRRICIININ